MAGIAIVRPMPMTLEEIRDLRALYGAKTWSPECLTDAERNTPRRQPGSAVRELERQHLAAIKSGSSKVTEAKPIDEHGPGRSAVYFIYAADCERVKVGTTRHLASRLRELSCGSPAHLTCLGWIPGGSAVERELHKRLADSRSHLEWFDNTAQLRAELHRFGIRLARPDGFLTPSRESAPNHQSSCVAETGE